MILVEDSGIFILMKMMLISGRMWLLNHNITPSFLLNNFIASMTKGVHASLLLQTLN